MKITSSILIVLLLLVVLFAMIPNQTEAYYRSCGCRYYFHSGTQQVVCISQFRDGGAFRFTHRKVDSWRYLVVYWLSPVIRNVGVGYGWRTSVTSTSSCPSIWRGYR